MIRVSWSAGRSHPHGRRKGSMIQFWSLIFLLTYVVLSENAWKAAAKGCAHYNGGSNCPKEAPCCKSGWCSNAESFCSLALGCEPEGSYTSDTCLPYPMCTNQMENFDRPESLVAVANFSGNPADASWTTDFVPNHARIENGQLVLSMRRSDEVNKYGRRPGFGATVSSTRWMLYGTVSARIRTGSSRQGVVSSFIFRNHMTGDEIDYEWVGKAPKEVQSNYYWHTPSHMDPKDIDYSNQRKTALPNDLSQEYHVYTIEWLPDRMSWYIDGNLVRTVLRTEVKNDRYPSSPCQIQFSIWDGGSDDPQIAEWAGGPPSWGDENSNPGSGSSPAVYEVFVDYVDIRCHTPLDPLAAAWPPKDQGFQGFVNPFAPNATGDALVIGDGAPAVSTLDRGGFHWPVPGERAVYAQPGRHLNQQQQQQQQHHQRKPSSSTSKFARLRESIGMVAVPCMGPQGFMRWLLFTILCSFSLFI